MDVKILIKNAKARFNHNSSKAYLKDKYQAKLIVADQGGLWKVTPELLAFLGTMDSSELILTDSYDNPVKVNPQDLNTKLKDVYTIVMAEWYNELKELENNR